MGKASDVFDWGLVGKRDISILQMLAEGKKYEEISDTHNLSVHTIKYHVKKLLKLTGYNNTLSLVAHAVAAGVVRL